MTEVRSKGHVLPLFPGGASPWPAMLPRIPETGGGDYPAGIRTIERTLKDNGCGDEIPTIS